MEKILYSPCSHVENAADGPGMVMFTKEHGFISLEPALNYTDQKTTDFIEAPNVRVTFHDVEGEPVSFELEGTDWACIVGNGQRFWKNPDTALSFTREAIGKYVNHKRQIAVASTRKDPLIEED